ncbi:hypothetical protein vseg_000464 [Gypsophila vaccaria]
MILAILLILVSSIFFLGRFLNYNSTKKPTSSSTKMINTIENCMNKDDGAHHYDLSRVFDTFDKDRDGYITRQELKESLNNIGISVLPKEVEDMVDTLDCNKDGLIDVNEFKKLYYELMIKGLEDDNDEVDVEGELKEAFNVFDEDKNGLISVKELGMVLCSLGLKQGNKLEDDQCREMIKKVDVDGDGMVNFDEFKTMMSSNCPSSRS